MMEWTIRMPLGSAGNTEFWTAKDWENHSAYREQLRKEGRLGEVVEHRVIAEPCPELDNADTGPALESSRLVILDLTKSKGI